MSRDAQSYRQILRSSTIIGGASVVTLALGVLRAKIVAILFGPAGVGVVGLFTNVTATGATLVGLGLGSACTRQIAEAVAREDPRALAAARRALFWGTSLLAVVGALSFWLFRRAIALWALGSVAREGDVPWLGIAVGLTVAAGSQSGLLNGMRRIADLAWVGVLGSVVATVGGVVVLLVVGERALLAFVIATPLASFLAGHLFVARLPAIEGPPTPPRELGRQWGALVRLGFAFMLAGLVFTVAQLLVRNAIQARLGEDAMGHFQASWAVSMTYIGVVLGAMGTDFFPRLTGAMANHDVANRIVNEQTEVALLLAGPVLLAMLGLAPTVIELLYSDSFAPAAVILRWQVLGDVLKVVSWPLGFIILARGDGWTFFMTEAVASAVFAAVSLLGLPWLGVEATGVACVVMYVSYLPIVYGLARSRTGFRWQPAVVIQLVALTAVAAFATALAQWSETAGVVVSCAAAALFGLHALLRLSHMTNLGGPVGKLVALLRALLDRRNVRPPG